MWVQEWGKAALKFLHNVRHSGIAKSGEKLFIKLDAFPAVPKIIGVVLFYNVKYALSDFVAAA